MKNSMKLLRSITVVLFLLAGMATAQVFNGQQAEANSNCSYTWCDSGECEGNENMTDCASPDGTPPCTDTINCQPDPGPKVPEEN